MVNEMVCLKDGNVKRIIVPYVLRKKLIQQWHSDPISNNHLGFEKTYEKMSKQFYWEGMKEDVRAMCQSCQPCQLRKSAPNTKRSEPLIPLEAPKTPFSRVHIDVIGPLKETLEGSRYIVSMIDALTKWLVIKPIKNATTEEIGKVLIKDLICTFSAPHKIVTDQGRQFISKDFAQLAKIYGFKHHLTTPYRHQSNGQIERYHRTVEEMLSTRAESLDWDEALENISFALNTSINNVTKQSPFFSIFLRDPRLPSDIILQEKFEDDRRLSRIYVDIRKIWKQIEETINKNNEKTKLTYDNRERTEQRNFEVAELILL